MRRFRICFCPQMQFIILAYDIEPTVGNMFSKGIVNGLLIANSYVLIYVLQLCSSVDALRSCSLHD